MRKLIYFGLFALSCGIFANSTLAGNVADCDVLTDPESDMFAPKLYGLCVAWHNANEKAKPGLADKFFDRAGFDVPGSGDGGGDPADFECPCWADVSIVDICALGSPDSVVSVGVFTRVFWDYESIEFEASVRETFGGDTLDPGCAHTIIANDRTGEEFLNDVQSLIGMETDAAICLLEADMIASLYDGGGCIGIEP
jgi:hypothetical protein